MLYGSGTGMSAIWALVIFAIVLPTMLLSVALIMAHFRQPSSPPGSDVERVLADRFARGEIDSEEYERRLATLRSTRR
ncbi:SHOCT domain-containing protein [Actinoplanes sp. TBRC 11911]|uniref:SHOCT domain-containing protein n=1 Tax=Actinoplanes sp. TBRC 11911 TaxID=2729386 RepID=UPI00145D6CA7|nr:SHOCT domain-containing protein [Actinoplanes sp. TBRC 11911]NMO57285.1 SHOCT domain-containing protein [Actinoplanes sp. TBRC 11911]